jgi:Putative zinc-finger
MILKKLFHGRWRSRVSLLAAGCLDGVERERTLGHLETCADCRREHTQSVAMFELLATDPVRDTELPVAVEFLTARVNARITASRRSPGFRRATLVYVLGVAAALWLAVPRLVPHGAAPALEPATRNPAAVTMDAAALRRLERTVAREQAVRYLNDAENVLMTVASAPRACSLRDHHVDLAEETLRSRELVRRRALLVAMDDESVASVRPVLEDVDHVLREVGSLDPCANPDDFLRVQRDIEERSLLMKMRLMSRELLG